MWTRPKKRAVKALIIIKLEENFYSIISVEDYEN
jgi:hypothetical protein